MFYNYTNEDFIITWDKFPYTFKSGMTYNGVAVSDDSEHSVRLTESVCDVFAHHLATKVLNDPKLSANRDEKGDLIKDRAEKQMLTYNVTSVEALKKRAVTTPDTFVDIPVSVNELTLMAQDASAEVIEAVEAAIEEVSVAVDAPAPKKRGRPRKEDASPSPEAEFNV